MLGAIVAKLFEFGLGYLADNGPEFSQKIAVKMLAKKGSAYYYQLRGKKTDRECIELIDSNVRKLVEEEDKSGKALALVTAFTDQFNDGFRRSTETYKAIARLPESIRKTALEAQFKEQLMEAFRGCSVYFEQSFQSLDARLIRHFSAMSLQLDDVLDGVQKTNQTLEYLVGSVAEIAGGVSGIKSDTEEIKGETRAIKEDTARITGELERLSEEILADKRKNTDLVRELNDEKIKTALVTTRQSNTSPNTANSATDLTSKGKRGIEKIGNDVFIGSAEDGSGMICSHRALRFSDTYYFLRRLGFTKPWDVETYLAVFVVNLARGNGNALNWLPRQSWLNLAISYEDPERFHLYTNPRPVLRSGQNVDSNDIEFEFTNDLVVDKVFEIKEVTDGKGGPLLRRADFIDVRGTSRWLSRDYRYVISKLVSLENIESLLLDYGYSLVVDDLRKKPRSEIGGSYPKISNLEFLYVDRSDSTIRIGSAPNTPRNRSYPLPQFEFGVIADDKGN